MAKATLEQLRKAHEEAVDANRDETVVEYKTGEALADEVYEVIEGKHHLPGVGAIGPGHRFRPTESQVRSGSLRGKARPLTAREMREVRAPRKYFAGADFDEMEYRARQAEAREAAAKQEDADRVVAEEAAKQEAAKEAEAFAAIPMADGTRALAQAANLSSADFADVLPAGADGQFTRRQVEEIIARKKGG